MTVTAGRLSWVRFSMFHWNTSRHNTRWWEPEYKKEHLLSNQRSRCLFKSLQNSLGPICLTTNVRRLCGGQHTLEVAMRPKLLSDSKAGSMASKHLHESHFAIQSWHFDKSVEFSRVYKTKSNVTFCHVQLLPQRARSVFETLNGQNVTGGNIVARYSFVFICPSCS